MSAKRDRQKIPTPSSAQIEKYLVDDTDYVNVDDTD